MARAVAVIRGDHGEETPLRFVSVELREPEKRDYHAWRDEKIARGRIDHKAHFNADTWAR